MVSVGDVQHEMPTYVEGFGGQVASEEYLAASEEHVRLVTSNTALSQKVGGTTAHRLMLRFCLLVRSIRRLEP